MYNEAIETLQAKANDLRAEMRQTVKQKTIPEDDMLALIITYQNRITELTDAILTLRSIAEDESKE